MMRENPPIEIRVFESREQEMNYVAIARGYSDAAEMRAKMAPLNGETRETFKRRLAFAKLEVK